ncbi:unnamed protein product, partial [Laminaria digitata]
GGHGRKPTAAEAAELLRRRSSVDEVIGLLSAPTADGGFEDEGEGARPNQFDPAQFDSWRNSLTKVLGHLGFDFEDEEGVPQGPEGKRSPTQNVSSRGTSQYLSWGGTSAMSFEEQPEEFHESLRQIPMRWRSSLSSIMTSMASNGGFDEQGAANGGGEGGTGTGGGGVDMDVGDGKGTGPGGERKRLEQQASLEMLQSVMRETLESMSGGGHQAGAEDGEEEAKAAAAAALAMGSMCRAKSNESSVGSTGNGNSASSSGGGGNSSGNGASSMMSGGGRSGRGGYSGPPTSGGMLDSGSSGGGGRHERRPSQASADAAYYMRQGGRGGGGGSGGGGQYALAAGGGGGVGVHHDHQTTF